MPSACPAHKQADVPRPAPADPLPPRPVRGRPQKTARPRTTGDPPSIILSPDLVGPRTQIRLGVRTHKPVTSTAERG
jgi:hypothetical protein